MRRIYADHNATTPLDPDVLAAMLPYFANHYGNASSVHFFGREARAAVDDARMRLARLLGAEESEIVFTSGGTESDNTVIFGVPAGHIITSAIEHHAVLHACRARTDCEVTYLPVDGDGLVNPDDLRRAIRPNTRLVSIMSANNETGTVQPVRELAAICREYGVWFHTDAVQSFGKVPVNVREWGVDLLSLTAHKFYGPKGVGALFIRRGVKLRPLLFGGSHENERRAGTENVAGIVGLAKAAELAVAKLEKESARLFQLTERLATGITETISGAHRNGHPRLRVPNTVNFSFEGCRFEGLLLGLDLEGVAVSSGSACAVGTLEPSHVLVAMGRSPALARGAVRYSLGTGNTDEDVEAILAATARVVARLRQLAPA
ncbi:MAG: cysteine desulfurase family protein [Verrucomicrobiae bacterium]|nr:cysteine desulfurase family protein [Verrucomicrobiae bacterium]